MCQGDRRCLQPRICLVKGILSTREEGRRDVLSSRRGHAEARISVAVHCAGVVGKLQAAREE